MSQHSKPTQCTRIAEYLKQFGSITQYEALQDLGIMRLASRISELRKNGYEINSKMISVTNRFGETCNIKQYFMATNPT